MRCTGNLRENGLSAPRVNVAHVAFVLGWINSKICSTSGVVDARFSELTT
jgi:hypothetical protein